MGVPEPEAGLVICYGYLWHREFLGGAEEGRKDRPAVVVLVVEREVGAGRLVTVLPVTHRAPGPGVVGVEIPAAVKGHLGLDGERSWVVVSEGNEFVWPGYDLRKISQTGRYDYGFLPPRFFRRIVEAFVRCYEVGRFLGAPRD